MPFHIAASCPVTGSTLPDRTEATASSSFLSRCQTESWNKLSQISAETCQALCACIGTPHIPLAEMATGTTGNDVCPRAERWLAAESSGPGAIPHQPLPQHPPIRLRAVEILLTISLRFRCLMLQAVLRPE